MSTATDTRAGPPQFDDAQLERERERRRRGREEMGPGVRLARIAGVDVVADWSLFIIFALVAFNLGWGVLPAWHPNWSPLLIWSVAFGAAVLFFASVVAHELSHAIVARATGTEVHRITLFLFGGMAHLAREPRSPQAELVMAAIGPIVSIVIGVAATFAGALLSADFAPLFRESPELAVAHLGPAATLLLWLGPVNIMLALFNLIPGFPLDGGRVLRALLWWSTGDLRKATRWAANAGRFVGIGLIAWGIFEMFTGALFSGLWLALIGWFLLGAAASGYRQVVLRGALENVPVSKVMRSRFESVLPEAAVEQFVEGLLMESDQQAFPVMRDGEMLGLVSAKDVRRVARVDWPLTPVRAVMTPREQLVVVEPSASASEALEKLVAYDVDQLPVVDRGALLGVVRRRDILKWVALSEPELPA